MPPTIVTSNILQTAAWVYSAPIGTTLPADTLAVGGNWPAGWVFAGSTLEPTKVTYKFDMNEIKIEQTMAPVRRDRIAEEIMLESVLAEHSAANLALAMAGEATTQAATTVLPGTEVFTVGGDPVLPTKLWGLEGMWVNPSGLALPLRLFIWIGTAEEGGTIEYGREKPAGIPLKIKGLADTSKPIRQQLMKHMRVMDNPTS